MGGLLYINVPWGQEFYDGSTFRSWTSCLWFQFQLLTVSVRLLCPNSTEDRTPRLLVKQLSRTSNTQKKTQSYIEKRRGRKEKEITRRKKRKVKREKNNQADNKIPKLKWILKIRLLMIQNQLHRVKKQKLKNWNKN